MSCAVTVLSLVCVGARLPSALTGQTQKLQLFAAGLAMPDGSIDQNETDSAAPAASSSSETKTKVPKRRDGKADGRRNAAYYIGG